MLTIESRESSSPIVTRAVAAGLRGTYTDNYLFPGWQKALLRGLGALPQDAARFLISRFQSFSGLPPKTLENFSLDHLIQARLSDYVHLTGKFPAVTIGAALGGASAYLSLALGGPFLPQAFVTTLRGGSPDGDINIYLERSLGRALEIAANNPGLLTIQHFDPVHDGWLTRWVNHLRFKILDLPTAYTDFIRQQLEPGGAVVYLESGAQWLRYRLGPRSVFQVGGWGDISTEEFLEGSDRIRAYLHRAGQRSSDWKLKDYPLERGAESEWGSEPGLGEALEAFCRVEGFRFVRITLPDPTDFSRLAFLSALALLGKQERQPSGVLVEMFSQFDSFAALQTGLLPLWLIFNTQDSARFLKEMAIHFPPGKPVFFSPLSTFSLTPDMAAWEEWQEAIERDFINIGARQSHYPADARALVGWVEPLRKWAAEARDPVTARLDAEELDKLAGQIQNL